MDNEVVITINDVEYHFKLKAQSIVGLEKMYGKNIFELFEDMNAGSIADILKAALLSPADIDKFELLDILLTKYSLLEIVSEILREIAIKSGLIKKQEITDMMSTEQLKN